jgi:hypothetical protein
VETEDCPENSGGKNEMKALELAGFAVSKVGGHGVLPI